MKKNISPAKALRTIEYLRTCERKIEKKYEAHTQELDVLKSKIDRMTKRRYVEFHCPVCHRLTRIPMDTLFRNPSLIQGCAEEVCSDCKYANRKDLLESWMVARLGVPKHTVRYAGSPEASIGKAYTFYIGPDANTSHSVYRKDFKSVKVQVWHWQIPWKRLYSNLKVTE